MDRAIGLKSYLKTYVFAMTELQSNHKYLIKVNRVMHNDTGMREEATAKHIMSTIKNRYNNE